jgi:hypothetical protein
VPDHACPWQVKKVEEKPGDIFDAFTKFYGREAKK